MWSQHRPKMVPTPLPIWVLYKTQASDLEVSLSAILVPSLLQNNGFDPSITLTSLISESGESMAKRQTALALFVEVWELLG